MHLSRYSFSVSKDNSQLTLRSYYTVVTWQERTLQSWSHSCLSEHTVVSITSVSGHTRPPPLIADTSSPTTLDQQHNLTMRPLNLYSPSPSEMDSSLALFPRPYERHDAVPTAYVSKSDEIFIVESISLTATVTPDNGVLLSDMTLPEHLKCTGIHTGTEFLFCAHFQHTWKPLFWQWIALLQCLLVQPSPTVYDKRSTTALQWTQQALTFEDGENLYSLNKGFT